MDKFLYQKEEFKKIRREIKNEFCSTYKICETNIIIILTLENISRLINLYDDYVFSGYIGNSIENGIMVSISNRMTSSGGKTIFLRRGSHFSYEIRISKKIIENFIEGDEEKLICGIVGEDALDALMLILEHELCHVLEFSLYGNSNCKANRFKNISYNLFGHKSSYHEILKSRNQRDKNTSKNYHFTKGQTVRFPYKNNMYSGVITNINKRATVMVKDPKGSYKDSNNVKYTKWYIPLEMLIN